MATKTTKPTLTLTELERRFPDEMACKTLLTKLRWPDGKITCPRCSEQKRVYKTSQPFRWKCKGCNKAGYRFSVLTGTVFENTNMPLTTWFRVAFLMISSKKGISALQVHRMIPPMRGEKGNYDTAWYMCHRIRAAMKDGLFARLAGEVEVDETYVGGDPKNRHGGTLRKWQRPRRPEKPRVPGTRFSDKTPVLGAIERKGNVVVRAINKVTAQTMRGFVQEVVSDKVSLIASDDHPGYRGLTKLGYPHESVRHSRGEYVKETVRGAVHTQHLDSFWSLLKRGLVGTYHQVSKSYLPLYLNEFSWRHNHRNDEQIFHALLAGC